ncbi:MAG: hypothetical protein PHH61_00030 [Candidatus Nanoarchaeia archaeon]|nr:hypothetical protein [Candidatus Nanoarchaeia archaeon]
MEIKEPKVKGILFLHAILFAKKRMGEDSIEKLGVAGKRYDMERWYPYSDFCGILDKMLQMIPDKKTKLAYKVGHDVFFGDVRWLPMFKGKDPKEVFSTNKRQDNLFLVGRFEMVSVENGLVLVKMTLWSKDGKSNEVWAQYYHGMLQGIMDLAGRSGQVRMEEKSEDDERAWFFRMTWQ